MCIHLCYKPNLSNLNSRKNKYLLPISYKVLRIQRCVECTFSLKDINASCTLSTQKGPGTASALCSLASHCGQHLFDASISSTLSVYTPLFREPAKPFEHLLDRFWHNEELTCFPVRSLNMNILKLLVFL